MSELSGLGGKVTQGSTIAKCIYCRDPCLPTNEQPYTSESCARCIKNERKYGKPSVCHYCQLPAAFLGKLCHLCSHYKKQYGLPVPCRHCKLKAAFDKRPPHQANTRKPLLCRLCKMTYNKSVAIATEKRGAKRKHSPEFIKADLMKKNDQSEHSSSSSTMTLRHTNESKFSGDSFASKFKSIAAVQETKESLNEHVLIVNQLKDELLSLRRQVQSKEQEVFCRDKKITDLKAQLLQMDRQHRFKMQEAVKQHQNTIEILQVNLENFKIEDKIWHIVE